MGGGVPKWRSSKRKKGALGGVPNGRGVEVAGNPVCQPTEKPIDDTTMGSERPDQNQRDWG